LKKRKEPLLLEGFALGEPLWLNRRGLNLPGRQEKEFSATTPSRKIRGPESLQNDKMKFYEIGVWEPET